MAPLSGVKDLTLALDVENTGYMEWSTCSPVVTGIDYIPVLHLLICNEERYGALSVTLTVRCL